jgi:hypothetical protein
LLLLSINCRNDQLAAPLEGAKAHLQGGERLLRPIRRAAAFGKLLDDVLLMRDVGFAVPIGLG